MASALIFALACGLVFAIVLALLGRRKCALCRDTGLSVASVAVEKGYTIEMLRSCPNGCEPKGGYL